MVSPCSPPTAPPVLDDDGLPVMRPLTGAEMSAIIRRLKDCNITVAKTGTSTPEEIARKIGQSPNFKFPKSMPPVSLDDDQATA